MIYSNLLTPWTSTDLQAPKAVYRFNTASGQITSSSSNQYICVNLDIQTILQQPFMDMTYSEQSNGFMSFFYNSQVAVSASVDFSTNIPYLEYVSCKY